MIELILRDPRNRIDLNVRIIVFKYNLYGKQTNFFSIFIYDTLGDVENKAIHSLLALFYLFGIFNNRIICLIPTSLKFLIICLKLFVGISP